jgi:autotransporter-associated beta strand protein
VWNGAGANDNWSTAANWVGALAPTSAATTFLTFPAASARFGPVVDAAFTLNRIDVTGGTSYAMTGLAITFAGATPQLNTSGAAHTIANPITLSSALTVTNASALTLSGAIGGGVALTKTGAGTLTLSGASTYSGGTTVGAGTLLVAGTMPGTVTVGAGATLGGTGSITGPVAVNAGGALAPGVSPGVINTGSLTLSGALNAEITGTTLGTQYDSVNVTGTVTITGGTLSLSGAYVPVVGDVFTLVSNDLADAVTGTFTGLPEAGTLTFNGSTLRISYVGGTGNDITLTAISLTTLVWNGAGANDNWSTAINWVVGVAPTSGATTFLTFPAASARFTPVADAPISLNRIDVTGASAYALSGQAITFAGVTPQLNTSGAAHTIANPITLSADNRREQRVAAHALRGDHRRRNAREIGRGHAVRQRHDRGAVTVSGGTLAEPGRSRAR